MVSNYQSLGNRMRSNYISILYTELELSSVIYYDSFISFLLYFHIATYIKPFINLYCNVVSKVLFCL